jgi:asparagine synthase (glutamine-hydrolysing)
VIASEVARHGANVKTISVAFEGDLIDLGYARQIAQRFDLPHEVIEAEGSSLEDGVADMLAQYDEPFADSAALPALALSRALKGRYKVALNGDGGDEAFGGYRHYEFIAAKQMIKAVAAAAGLADGSDSSTEYVQAKATFRNHDRCRLTGRVGADRGPLDRLLRADPFLSASGIRPGALMRALWSDRHLQLANGLAYKMDIALAAHGIEGRAPFLDHRILEWTAHLDNRDLVRGRSKKVLLRRAYRDELGDAVYNRPKKGFGAPVAQWLAGPLREQVRETLPSPWLDRAAQLSEIQGGNAQRVWTLFVLARWAAEWGATL